MSRKYTNKLLEIVDEGLLDKMVILTAALNALSEDEVEQMCRANDLLEAMGMEEEDDPEDDGQPDEAQEWHDFNPDC